MTVTPRRLRIGSLRAPGFTSYSSTIGGKKPNAYPGYGWFVYQDEGPMDKDRRIVLSGPFPTIAEAHNAAEKIKGA